MGDNVRLATSPDESDLSPNFPRLADFMENVLQAFQRAKARTATLPDQVYGIGAQRLQLCFANQQLATLLTPALAHLARPGPVLHPTAPLTVYLWDSVSSGVALPPLPPALQQADTRPTGWGVYAHTPTIQAFLQPTHQLLSLFDQTRNVAVYWTADAQQLPSYEGSAPLVLLLHWWLGQHQRQVVHSAAVGTGAGATLLVGKSGAGKSTTALRCLHDGLLYLGDDYCLLGVEDTPMLYSLYNSVKIYAADIPRFPRLQQALGAAPAVYTDKKLYFCHEPLGPSIARQLPMRAVLIPTITRERATWLEAASPAQAMVALAPSTTFQLPGAHTHTIRQVSQVLRKVPCYWLKLGTELAQIPQVISQLLNNDGFV